MENQVATQEKTNKLTGFCYSFGEVEYSSFPGI